MTTSETLSHASSHGIAVIGMSGRFPGAKNLAEFWANLCNGVESSSNLSDEEMLAAGVKPAHVRHPNFVKTRPILDEVEWFDAAFFGFTPREAELLDPQHRAFLECAWEALEDAGYDSERFPGWIGVYGGAALNSYLLNNLYSNQNKLAVSSLQWISANEKDYLTTRVSYKLNLKGPSLNVQSACSTSLAAVHLACQGLLSYQCDLALAGGVSIAVPQRSGYFYEEGSMVSPDGHCRAFDAQANGTVFGSGVGVVVLKRLPEALADGDSIRAVILGSAINNDGAQRAGFTAPGVAGQAAAIAMAQAVAGVEPESITYIEAHGTGTTLGDPIEVEALTQAFRAGTSKIGFCGLGSVKTNIGHLDAAAGVAGLIKTILALQHKRLPPSLNFQRPNPRIDFAHSPFYVNTQLRDWNPAPFPRRTGVSSFGVGGANAHVVLEEALPPTPRPPSQGPQLLVLSTKTETALEAATIRLREHLKHQPEIDLAEVAYTLQVGRRAFPHRRAFVCATADEAVRILETRDPLRLMTAVTAEAQPSVVFMFPGQGTQVVRMGEALYQSEPTFRQTLDQCNELLRPHLGVDLKQILYPPLTEQPAMAEQLDQTAWAQPVLFAVEYALAQLWQTWGIKPRALIGHSVGEYVAACLAGVFSLETGLALVVARGRLMQSLPAGAMLAIPLSAAEVQPELDEDLSLAAINGTAQCVVSGSVEKITALQNRLTERGLTLKRLQTSHAFHSGMMEPILAPFAAEFKGFSLKPPQIPFVSNVSGRWITAAQATDPNYWAQHLRQTVRFADGLQELLKQPQTVLLEVGPGNTLSTLARRHPDRREGHLVVPSGGERGEAGMEAVAVQNALGRLWLAGLTVDWPRLQAQQPRRRVPLPTYPFERQRYWIEPNLEASPYPDALARKPDLTEWFYLPSWTRHLSPALLPTGELQKHPGNWLVFLDAFGFGARLIERLRAENQRVTAVEIGADFHQQAADVYTLRPERPEDYRALFKALRELDLMPTRIIHLWGRMARPEAEAPPTLEVVETRLSKSFYSLLFLAQALGAQPALSPIQIAIISNGLQEVAGDEVLAPERATALGLVHVLPQEYPQLVCRSIDLDLAPAPEGQVDQEADQLLAELISAPPDPVVAYRRGYRWVQTYSALPLAKRESPSQRLRSGGVYLITGGLGGIGLELASYLAQAVQAKLVLVSRSTFPPRAEWDAWQARQGEADGVSQKIIKLQAIEAYGAEIEIMGGDVTDLEQMRGVIHQTLQRFGALHGVIHAAGLPGGGMAQLKTRAMAGAVLAPKVWGTRVLEAALKGRSLDFLILCSSTLSILGGFGQVDYAAANAFLDAFAQQAARQTSTLSINWDAWEEVGMAVKTATRQAPTAPNSIRALTHPLLNEALRTTSDRAVYRSVFNAATHWVLSEHHILGQPALPGTACLEMVRAAFEDLTQSSTAEFQDVYFLTPLTTSAGETREARTVLTREAEGFAFQIISRPARETNSAWQEHARGTIRLPLAPATRQVNPRHRMIEVETKTLTLDQGLTGVMSEHEWIHWGPHWDNLKSVQLGQDRGLAQLKLADSFLNDLGAFTLHPALLDVATAFINPLAGEGHYLPFAYKRLQVYAPLGHTLQSFAQLTPTDYLNKEIISFDILILDENDSLLVQIEGFTLKRLSPLGAGGDDSLLPRRTEMQRAATLLIPETELESNSGITEAGRLESRFEGIRPAEGVEAFARILDHPELRQVVISTHDLNALSKSLKATWLSNSLGTDQKRAAQRVVHPRPTMPTAYTAPGTEAERVLSQIWQEALGLERVGLHDNFFELGGDSVLGIQIISLAQRAGLSLTAGQLFEHQTIAALVAAGVGNSSTPVKPVAATRPADPQAADGVEAPTTQSTRYSADDFPEAGLSQEALDQFINQITKPKT